MLTNNAIKAEIITITPSHAKSLLDANRSNRKVSPRNLSKVKEALLNEEWKLNGEAIKIAGDGRVLDGQHRLFACAETGVPFTTMIVYGLDGDTQDTMDSGKSRTPADALTLQGHKNSTNLAAVTMAIIRCEKWGLKQGLVSSSGYPVTTPQVVNRVESEPTLTDLVTIGKHATKGGLTARTAGLLYYVLSAIDADDAEYFFGRFSSGEGLERGNPILTLRNSLISLKAERGQKDQSYVGALVIKAWNRYRSGQESLHLSFRPGGSKPESFPTPR